MPPPLRNGPKLPCPCCGHHVSIVLPDKAQGAIGDEYRRVRQCKGCAARFLSSEKVLRVMRRGKDAQV